MSEPLLTVTGLRAGYGEADVLHGIDLHVGAGEYVCVIGPNTAGKSTILRAISGVIPRAVGSILFAGIDLMRLKAHEVPALGIAHVPEGRQVFPHMTVEENLLLGAFTGGTRRISRSALPACLTFFRVFQSAASSSPERCQEANSRWLPSGAR